MQKMTLALPYGTVVQIPAGASVEAIQDTDGSLYLKCMGGLLGVSATPAPAPASRPVADDTARAAAPAAAPAKAPAPKTPAKPAPAKVPAAAAAPLAAAAQPTMAVATDESEAAADAFAGEVELSHGDLEEGTQVKVFLGMDETDTKLWPATVVATPAGGDSSKIYVLFQEDAQTDYLRDGDKVFEHKFDF